jgi:hypothetical protein
LHVLARRDHEIESEFWARKQQLVNQLLASHRSPRSLFAQVNNKTGVVFSLEIKYAFRTIINGSALGITLDSEEQKDNRT